MRQRFTVSRRNIMTLAAGTLAASAGAALTHDSVRHAVTSTLNPATLLGRSHRRMLELAQQIRRAGSSGARADAFDHLSTALRTHDFTELAYHDELSAGSVTPGGTLTALYRQREPEAILATVIVRELQHSKIHDEDWLGRFADLEAVIRSRARSHERAGHAAGALV